MSALSINFVHDKKQKKQKIAQIYLMESFDTKRIDRHAYQNSNVEKRKDKKFDKKHPFIF